MKLELVKTAVFKRVPCDFYKDTKGELYLVRRQIGKALFYADTRHTIAKMQQRHPDVLEESFLLCEDVKNNSLDNILYNIQGVYEICRLSKRHHSSEFADWVYCIVRGLKGEVAVVQEPAIEVNNDILEWEGKRVITSKMLSEMYGATSKMISNNFNNNKKQYTEGKDYFYLTKLDIARSPKFKDFKDIRNIAHLYLWTERGAMLHAKSLGTKAAWDVYLMLMDTYFKVKENTTEIVQPDSNKEVEELKQIAIKQSEMINKQLEIVSQQSVVIVEQNNIIKIQSGTLDELIKFMLVKEDR